MTIKNKIKKALFILVLTASFWAHMAQAQVYDEGINDTYADTTGGDYSQMACDYGLDD